MKRKILITLLAPILFFGGCVEDKGEDQSQDVVQKEPEEEPEEPVEQGDIAFDDIVIASSGSAFRGEWEEGDRIGLFIVERGWGISPDENYVDNSCLTYDGVSWISDTTLDWPEDGAEVDFLAYFPYYKDADPTDMRFAVEADQSGEGFFRSDIMSAGAFEVEAGDEVPLTFYRQMAMVQFILDAAAVRGDGEEITVVLQDVYPEASRVLGEEPSGETIDITMYCADEDETGYLFRALLPEQTLHEGARLFRVTVGGRSFESLPLTEDVLPLAGDFVEFFYAAPPSSVTADVTFTDGSTTTVSASPTADWLCEFDFGGDGSKTVYGIRLGGGEFLIGRRSDQTVTLKFDGKGNLLFRDADAGGNIPVGTYAELAMISTALDGNYIQEADLDLLGAASLGDDMRRNWTPIKSEWGYFSGSYDGGNHTLANLYIDASQEDGADIGLFGYVSYGKLSNIVIISGEVRGYNSVGGVCGTNYDGTITNCHNGAAIAGIGSYVGGVCGDNDGGTIIRCRNTGTITVTGNSSGVNFYGGVCGRNINPGAVVLDCYNSGEVSCRRAYGVGGVCGSSGSVGDIATMAVVAGSRNSGAVDGDSTVGGVCGRNYGAIVACYNTAEVTGSGGDVGGVCGYNENNSGKASVTACYNTGAASSQFIQDRSGGVCGGNDGAVTSCYYSPFVEFVNDIGIAFGQDAWPVATADGWGVSADGTDGTDGKSWASLGGWNGGTPAFPRLWWEE